MTNQILPSAARRKHRLAAASFAEAAELVTTNPVVFVPFGSLEQNGPQNPLATDTLLSVHFAEAVAAKVEGIAVPAVPFGISDAFGGFAGTIALRPATLAAVACDVFESLVGHGFRRIVVVNGHGPNQAVLEHAIRTIDLHNRVDLIMVWPGQIAGQVALEQDIVSPAERGHGAEPTTSLMLALCPDDVRLDLAVADRPHSPTAVEVLNSFSGRYDGRPIAVFNDMHRVNPTGVTGDPAKASVERGQRILGEVIAWGERLVRDWVASLPS